LTDVIRAKIRIGGKFERKGSKRKDERKIEVKKGKDMHKGQKKGKKSGKGVNTVCAWRGEGKINIKFFWEG
jgi:hypothetical protein